VGVILNSLAAALAAKAHLTVLVAGAVLVGATGGVYVATSTPGHSVTVTTVAEKTPADTAQRDKAKPHKDQQKASHAAKPTTSPRPVGVVRQTHGACVSAIAHEKKLVGGHNHNHGGAVSAAAHSCSGSAEENHKDNKPDRVGKPGKPPKPVNSTAPSDDEQDTTTPAS